MKKTLSVLSFLWSFFLSPYFSTSVPSLLFFLSSSSFLLPLFSSVHFSSSSSFYSFVSHLRFFFSLGSGNIKIFDLNGNYVKTSPVKLNCPMGIFIDDQHRIIVAETTKSRIKVFDRNWNLLKKFGEKVFFSPFFGLFFFYSLFFAFLFFFSFFISFYLFFFFRLLFSFLFSIIINRFVFLFVFFFLIFFFILSCNG